MTATSARPADALEAPPELPEKAPDAVSFSPSPEMRAEEEAANSQNMVAATSAPVPEVDPDQALADEQAAKEKAAAEKRAAEKRAAAKKAAEKKAAEAKAAEAKAAEAKTADAGAAEKPADFGLGRQAGDAKERARSGLDQPNRGLWIEQGPPRAGADAERPLRQGLGR